MARTYTFSVPDEKLPLLDEIKKIAKREGRPVSDLIVSLIEDYVKKHGGGNPNFRLDDFAEEEVVKAWPTLGHDPEKFDLSGFTEDEKREMLRYARAWVAKIESSMAKEEEAEKPRSRLIWQRYRCLDCGHEFGWWHEVYECPKCKSRRIAYLGLEKR